LHQTVQDAAGQRVEEMGVPPQQALARLPLGREATGLAEEIHWVVARLARREGEP
jgi:hypothetical protein